MQPQLAIGFLQTLLSYSIKEETVMFNGGVGIIRLLITRKMKISFSRITISRGLIASINFCDTFECHCTILKWSNPRSKAFEVEISSSLNRRFNLYYCVMAILSDMRILARVINEWDRFRGRTCAIRQSQISPVTRMYEDLHFSALAICDSDSIHPDAIISRISKLLTFVSYSYAEVSALKKKRKKKQI